MASPPQLPIIEALVINRQQYTDKLSCCRCVVHPGDTNQDNQPLGWSWQMKRKKLGQNARPPGRVEGVTVLVKGVCSCQIDLSLRKQMGIWDKMYTNNK